jgi:hypothetical protein
MTARNTWLWGALAATLAATWYAAGPGDGGDAGDADGLAATVRGPARAPGPPAAAAPATLAAPITAPITAPVARLGDSRMAPPRSALMAPHDWRPPPPPPPPPAAQAAPPQAPALPFRYLGRLDEGDGSVVVFLGEGTQPRPHMLRVGERLRDYQLQAITAQGLSFVYLPLNQQQQLLFGSTP